MVLLFVRSQLYNPSIGAVNFKVDVQNGYSFCGNPMKRGCVYILCTYQKHLILD